MMPSFHGSAIDAANAGYAPRPCAHCGNWTWVKHDQTERVFCSRKQCEHTEGESSAGAARALMLLFSLAIVVKQ
jgi:hypothetical protein